MSFHDMSFLYSSMEYTIIGDDIMYNILEKLETTHSMEPKQAL